MPAASRNKIFCEERFKTLLGASTVGMVIPILILVANTAIVGNILDEKALAAMNVFMPLLTFFIGLSDIVSIGTSYIYNYLMGQADKPMADRILGQSLILSTILAILTFTLANVCFGHYLAFLDVSDEMARYVGECFTYYKYVLLLYPFYFLLSDMVLADGDARYSNLSNIFLLIGCIGVSILACKAIGIAGIGLGALTGTAAATLILCLHFFRKGNSLRPRLFFSFKSLFYILRYSSVDASLYLLVGIQTYALNKIMIIHYGEFYLPVLTLVTSIIQITIIFDGIGQAMSPLANVYHGEGNPDGVRKVMKISIKTAIGEGLIFSALLACAAPFLPHLFNIESQELVPLTTKAFWIVCPTLFCTSLLFLFTSYFLVLRNIFHSLFICLLKDLVIPICSVLLFSDLFGFTGIWIGLALSPVLTISLTALISKLRFLKKKFPFFLDESSRKIYSFDFLVTPENTMKIQDEVGKTLTRENVSSKSVIRAALLIEEIYMLLIEKNTPKVLLSELTIFLGDHVVMIFRDDGEIFDLTSESNATGSFRGFVVQNIMEHQKDKKNITTTSYNRNFIILPL